MRIKAIYIDNFGIYQQHSVADLPKGLVVLVGDNESGKTTLLNFMRSIFFGFPRNSEANCSGKLLIEDQDGQEYLISRSGKTVIVTDGNGQRMPFDPAMKWLSGLDRNTYQKIFAISLEDLQGLKLLAENTVRSRFFAAGAGGTVLVEAIKKVDEQREELLIAAAQGKKLINRLLKEQDGLAVKSREAKKDEALYAALVAKRTSLVSEIQQQARRLEEINGRLAQLAQLEQAWEPWTRMQLEKEKEEELQNARNFPANGLARLEQLLHKRQDNRQDVQEKNASCREATEQLTALLVDDAIIRVESDIERIYSEKGRLAIESKQQPLQLAEQQSLKEQYERSLREIGPEWHDKMLDEVDISVAVRQRVQDYAARFLQAEQKIGQAKLSERQTVQALEELNKEVAGLRQRLEQMPVPAVADEREMEQLEEGLRITRSELIKGEQIRQARTAAVEAAAGLDRQLAQLHYGRNLRHSLLPGWAGPVFGAGCLAGAWFLWQVSMAAAVVTAIGGVFTALVVLRQRQLQLKERSAWTQHTTTEEQLLQQHKAKTAGAIVDLDRQEQICESRLDAATQAMGLGKPDTLEEADELEKQVVTIRKAFENWLLLTKQLEILAGRQKSASQLTEVALIECQECFRQKQVLEEEWRSWLSERHFSQESSPEAFEIVLKAVETARSLQRQYAQAKARTAAAGEYLENLQADFLDILKKAGRHSQMALTVHNLETLYQELAQGRVLTKEKAYLQQTVSKLQASLEQSREQAAAVEAALTELFREAGTDGEEEFRALAERHNQWRSSRDTLDKLAAALRVVAGTAAKQVYLEEALQDTSLTKITQEKNNLQSEKSALERDGAQKPQEVGAIANQLKQLGQDDKMNLLLAERNAVDYQLSDAGRQWAKLALTRHLLEQARNIYEQERQPSVILEADKFLRIMTDNRYQMVSAIGGSDVQLVDKARNSKGENAWSSGLGDQVYLAVRLGLALEFGRLLEPLPLILDDVLVRFDAPRQQGTAKVLLEVAKTQQVFLFSCHKHTRQLIRNVHACGEDTSTSVVYYDVNNGTICLSR